MKKIFIIIILIVSVSYLPVKVLSGSSPSENNNKISGDSALIIKLENDFSNAIVNRDEAKINILISDEFIYTENENMYSRSEVIQSFLSVSDVIESAYNEDLQVHLYDNTAIVTGWLFINGKSSGTEFKRKYRFTDIWLKKNEDWQIIAAQDYLMPK
jgi:ketosteroid isomerase-like protein